MGKSFAVRTRENILPVNPIISVASLKYRDSPQQYWSRLHLAFLLAEHAKDKHPEIY